MADAADDLARIAGRENQAGELVLRKFPDGRYELLRWLPCGRGFELVTVGAGHIWG
jgi:hypothetical protein